ncbi:YqcC family protein [Pseudoalteromonas agarivorans]|uniref:YqcC family protein n=1 Tax=Pseudoalteromonas TaxID=53246 RepID=UPI001B388B3F|nr:YqcC family protein [Pseudoalteromonas sp. MMG007]MBQ4858664.1 YqcC family protein [Pseudoalteromonas sp. MMG007]
MYQQTQAYLNQLTALLKKHQLWQAQPIAPEALNSSVPFCHDTMAFEQWLQFVFIEKVQYLVTHQQPLPRNFAIAPMAQMTLTNKNGSNEIIELLTQLDAFLGEPNE